MSQLIPAGRDALYGRNAVAEALAGRRQLHRLFVAEGVREDDRLRLILRRAEVRTVPADRVPRMQLDDLTGGTNHQGVVLEAGPYRYGELEDMVEHQGTILVLDHVQDPQNLGTLLRAAEVAGASGVVIARDRAAEVTPAVVNASAGAVEHLLVAQETNIGRALDRLGARGWWSIGLDTGSDAVDLFSASLPAPVALVIGSEGTGLSPVVRKRCEVIVSLPVRGKVASLNAATAGAIALFDILRRETEPLVSQ
jgi:23S rRNA (guanosine2251-2'-O)-methyltransferase